MKSLEKISDAARKVIDSNVNNNVANVTSPLENNNLSTVNNVTSINPHSEILNMNSSILPDEIDLRNNKSLIYKSSPLFKLKNFPFFINLEES